jgi:cbb3-type cytochrome oxidase maturation protein
MTALALLVPLALGLGLLALLFFVWTLRSGQYEDPEGAGSRILFDDIEETRS